jgi:hypothetical protein
MNDDILQQIERDSRERHERVRQLILSEGRPDLLAELDGQMRRIHLGLDGAGSTWQSISNAQRKVLLLMAEGRHLRRAPSSRTRYDAIGEPHAISNVCGLPTVRNLCARELCHVDGGAMDPERKIVLTERGTFVVKHGPSQPRM